MALVPASAEICSQSDDDDDEDGEESEEEEPVPTPVCKPLRRNQFKTPDYLDFQKMSDKDRKYIYKKSRFIQARQLHLIAALQQQLNAERTSNALLKSGNETTYRLEVDTPYDKCEFPREMGDGQGPPDRSRVDSDWVVVRRSRLLFDVKIVQVDKDDKYSTADPSMGTESGKEALSLSVILCDELGDKIPDAFLAVKNDSGEMTSNELTFDMITNATRIGLTIRATSLFLKAQGYGDGKVRLKFETSFRDKRLEWETRPFYITQRISAGKTSAEPWNSEVLNAVCDECAVCSKRLQSTRAVS